MDLLETVTSAICSKHCLVVLVVYVPVRDESRI